MSPSRERFQFDTILLSRGQHSISPSGLPAARAFLMRCRRTKPFMVNTVPQRIARHADVFTCRASGKADWVVRDFDTVRQYLRSVGRGSTHARLAHVQTGYVVDTANRHHALAGNVNPWKRLWARIVPGSICRECYLVGSIDDIVERLKFLESKGLEQSPFNPLALKWHSSTCGWTRLSPPTFAPRREEHNMPKRTRVF